MKTLALLALSAVATAAMATGPAPDYPDITISGNSHQNAVFTSMGVANKALNNGEAMQNVASNGGNVTISGRSEQNFKGQGGALNNTADGKDAYASQNVSSNLGNVTVTGHSSQYTSSKNAVISNYAAAESKAVQNIASNNACSTCQPTKKTSGWGH